MKDFLQNLLIALALCLCGMCAWQWNFQTNQRGQLEEQNRVIFQRDEAIQGFTNSMHTMDGKIAEMDQRITELTATNATNRQLLLRRDLEVFRLTSAIDTLTNQISQYSNAVADLQTKLKDAYDGVQKQNEAISNVVAQRDDFFKKLNDSIQERNGIVTKYNDVVNRLNQMQAGTNAPGK
jgi:chromosome segregation ATPase